MLKNKGFTLIELMVVIVIIGILATLAIPKFNEASLKAKVSEAPTVLSTYENAQLAYLAEAASVGAMSSLVIEDPTAAGFSKYFTYSHTASNSAGVLQAQASSAGMGELTDKTLNITVNSDQSSAKDAAAEYTKYLPNWN